MNKIEDEDLEILNKRTVQPKDIQEGTIILAPTNRKVDDINNTNLYKLETPTFTYNAIIKGSWKDKEHPVKKEIVLKVGAQIMITKNDMDDPKRWVNGTLGVITFLSKDQIKVKIDDKIFSLGKTKWDKYNYQFIDNKVSTKSVGSFIQFQTYVALSRAKTIEGISLLKNIRKKDIIFDHRVLEFIGQKLESKYIKEITMNNKIIKKKSTKVLKNKTLESDWTTSEDNKLLALYKRNVPEFALSKILKKNISQIRERVILLMKK
jgi:hypothetical protein